MFRCTFEGMFGRTIIPLYKVVSKAGWRPPFPTFLGRSWSHRLHALIDCGRNVHA